VIRGRVRDLGESTITHQPEVGRSVQLDEKRPIRRCAGRISMEEGFATITRQKRRSIWKCPVFELAFALPDSLVGKPEIHVSVEVGRTFRPASDPRDLGLVFGVFEVK
jgi:hypothetical protein